MYFLSWTIFSKSCTEPDSYTAVPFAQFQNDCVNGKTNEIVQDLRTKEEFRGCHKLQQFPSTQGSHYEL